MRGFSKKHPLVVLLWLLSVSVTAMFSMNPLLAGLSLLGAAALFCTRRPHGGGRTHVLLLLLGVVTALINPLISHNGETVLFVMNDNPVTAQALAYGGTAALLLMAVLYWFCSLSQIMTTDKWLCLIGPVAPKTAVLISMALRYHALLARQAGKIHRVQTTMGLYREDNAVVRLRGAVRELSVLATWSLENGIVTADSMDARGYGLRRRTSYATQRLDRADVVWLVVCAALTVTVVSGLFTGSLNTVFYPAVRLPEFDVRAGVTCAAYALLALLPAAMETGETIRWMYLQSKI